MQTSVNDMPVQAYEGKVHVSGQFPTSVISKAASELIYFGKLVVPYATTELAVGGAEGGPQRVKLPTTAAEVDSVINGGGVAIADPSIERLRNPANPAQPAPFGAYPAEDMAGVMRRGLIWVVSEAEITDLTAGVFVRWQNAGGTPPAASLGSFAPATSADRQQLSADLFSWQGAATINSVYYGLLSVNMA